MEQSHAIISDSVCHVVSEFTKFSTQWSDVRVERSTDRRALIIHPESIFFGASCPVSNNDVIRMSDPEVSRSLISVQKGPGLLCASDHIICDVVFSFCTILDKDCVSHCIPVTITLDSQILDTVNSCATIIAAHHCVVSDIRLGYASNHMIMDWILSKKECLSYVVQLQVLNTSNYRFVTWRVKHDMGSELVSSRGFWVSTVDYIS